MNGDFREGDFLHRWGMAKMRGNFERLKLVKKIESNGVIGKILVQIRRQALAESKGQRSARAMPWFSLFRKLRIYWKVVVLDWCDIGVTLWIFVGAYSKIKFH
ncbi:hypothetical protein AAMO2058_001507500 [Amorphochlora amoebiformis]